VEKHGIALHSDFCFIRNWKAGPGHWKAGQYFLVFPFNALAFRKSQV
jgi:hypothetical protein